MHSAWVLFKCMHNDRCHTVVDLLVFDLDFKLLFSRSSLSTCLLAIFQCTNPVNWFDRQSYIYLHMIFAKAYVFFSIHPIMTENLSVDNEFVAIQKPPWRFSCIKWPKICLRHTKQTSGSLSILVATFIFMNQAFSILSRVCHEIHFIHFSARPHLQLLREIFMILLHWS